MAAERHGDVFAAEAKFTSGYVGRVTFADHHAAADFQIGYEVNLLGTGRIDVHGGVDDIQTFTLQRRNKPFEFHRHWRWRQLDLFA